MMMVDIGMETNRERERATLARSFNMTKAPTPPPQALEHLVICSDPTIGSHLCLGFRLVRATGTHAYRKTKWLWGFEIDGEHGHVFECLVLNKPFLMHEQGRDVYFLEG
uniref:Uncharacterized protein n=1 Tax=Peronospora matthiolae TaxID=2874970 RepID=A0AAV1VKA9_9STRA